jgi:Fic family protein
MYIYQQPDWPHFTWDKETVMTVLLPIHRAQGRLLGRMEALGFPLNSEAQLQTLTLDVVKTSEIEGEVLDAAQVRSSLARRLGLDIAGLVPSDRNVDGVVEMLLDATQRFDAPLTADRLFGWHASLFPSGRSGMHRITVGNWRIGDKGPMQVVSGAMGKEKMHFEAPDSSEVEHEMRAFLEWFEKPQSPLDPILKSAIAHLWFVTIHPFDDGNGRMARAIADLQLARADGIPQRFYSMSAQIRLDRKAYYDILEKTQRGTTDITPWLLWFLECIKKAVSNAEITLANVLYKSKMWEGLSQISLNPRQHLMINKLLDGFEGKLTTSKWAKIARCSHDTAFRDIQDLIEAGVLVKDAAGGRSTGYELVSVIRADD